MRDVNLDNTASNFCESHELLIEPNRNAICSKVVYHTQALWFGTASLLT